MAQPNFSRITARDGVLLYEDGSEVALWGTNYLPMSWAPFQNLKKLGADFRSVIRQDVADMKRSGVQIVRVHFFDSECSDAEGNLIDNEHLEVFDILVDELGRQGVYLFLTPIAWWWSPDARPDAFGRQMTIPRMMFDRDAVEKSARFVTQLLGHGNRFTSIPVKDEPCLAVCEIINEPMYITWEMHDRPELYADIENRFHDGKLPREVVVRDVEEFRSRFHAYCSRESVAPSRDSFENFKYETHLDYLETMVAAFRGAGARQPVAASLYLANGSKPSSEMIEFLGLNAADYDFTRRVNDGIIRAVGDSPVDAVTTGGYPNSRDTGNEHRNLLAEHAGPAGLPEEVAGKAVMIYEWDMCYTHENVVMYPAMARKWRSMRAQVCCQFQYTDSFTGRYNADWPQHWLNYELTPAKTVAFHAAAKVFAEWPRGGQYPVGDDGFVTETAAVSFSRCQVLHAADGSLLHSNSIGEWLPLDIPDVPRSVQGRGSSPYAQYTGSGIYLLERLSGQSIRLELTRNATAVRGVPAIFSEGRAGDVEVMALGAEPEEFELRLPGWETFACATPDGEPVAVTNRRFAVIPGRSYLLSRSGTGSA